MTIGSRQVKAKTPTSSNGGGSSSIAIWNQAGIGKQEGNYFENFMIYEEKLITKAYTSTNSGQVFAVNIETGEGYLTLNHPEDTKIAEHDISLLATIEENGVGTIRLKLVTGIVQSMFRDIGVLLKA
jgi:hypothetical protein